MVPAPQTLWARQSLQQQADGVRNTLSSWDNCMDKAYCKWPVIIAIIIGSLIVLSILFCLVRCMCCGLECCCGCLSCCNACCPSPRGGNRDRTKFRDPPNNGFTPAPYQGYQPTPIAPTYNGPQQPQYAQFDDPKRRLAPGAQSGNADALPAMPSWDAATSRRIVDDSQQDVEMEKLNGDHADDSSAPMLAHQGPVPESDHAYQQHGGPGSDLGSSYHDPYNKGPAGAGMAGAGGMAGMAGAGAGVGTPPRSPPRQPPSSGYADRPGMANASPASSYRRPLAAGVAGPSRLSTTSSPAPEDALPSHPAPGTAYGGPPTAISNNYHGPNNTTAPSTNYYGPSSTTPMHMPSSSSNYAPSAASTRFEPSSYNNGQESGTAYRPYQPQNRAPPPQRRPVQNSWQDI